MTNNVSSNTGTNIILMFCDKCETMIGTETLDTHDKICTPPKIVQTTKVNKNAKTPKVAKVNKTTKDQEPIIDIELLPHQLKAVKWCSLKARIYNKNIFPNALIRFLSIGYTEEDISTCLDYIKNIDLIAHFGREGTPPQWLKTETHFRNAFEVNPKGAGYLTNRKEWEDNLFNKIYDDNCDDSSKVKYGCCNLLSDPIGCYSATGYGSSYMIFKNKVKSRATFVCGDSSSKQLHMCTFDHCVQLLLYMDDATLKNVIRLAKMKKTKQYSNESIDNIGHQRQYTYIEVQIHGEVVLNRDIAHIMLHNKHYDKEILNRLDRSNIPYTVFDENYTKHYKPLFII